MFVFLWLKAVKVQILSTATELFYKSTVSFYHPAYVSSVDLKSRLNYCFFFEGERKTFMRELLVSSNRDSASAMLFDMKITSST